MVEEGPSCCIVKNHLPFKVHLNTGRIFRRNNNSFESFVESDFQSKRKGGDGDGTGSSSAEW